MSKNKNVSELDTEKTAAELSNTAETVATPVKEDVAENNTLHEGTTAFAYVGPSLPNGKLKNNTILNGTYAQITDYYKEVIDLYPAVTKLFVPVSRLAEVREKVKKGGNIFNKYYEDIAAKIKAEGAKE